MNHSINPLKTAVIFGGSGFVGCHYAQHLIETHPDLQVILCDLEPFDPMRFAKSVVSALSSQRCRFQKVDVRQPISTDWVTGEVVLVANFAAVHREPGHRLEEYWNTNIPGAENVTSFASRVNCSNLVFTSSISPYGVSTEVRNEKSQPTPSTPYGCSKYTAEKIHLAWQCECADRRLLIVRPGVVYGAGEGGNVTRMLHFLRKGIFMYLGNRHVRKSGIYVKELCNVMDWSMEQLENPAFCNIRAGAAVVNASFQPPPSLEEYVNVICSVGGFNPPAISIPYRLLYMASFFFIGIGGIHPTRIRKLVRPNIIIPDHLVQSNYPWKWTLQTAFKDWKSEKPEDWRK